MGKAVPAQYEWKPDDLHILVSEACLGFITREFRAIHLGLSGRAVVLTFYVDHLTGKVQECVDEIMAHIGVQEVDQYPISEIINVGDVLILRLKYPSRLIYLRYGVDSSAFEEGYFGDT